MNRHPRHLFAAALLAGLLAPGSALAQQDANVERGFAADKLYSFGNLETVNMFNGNLTLTIPIGPTYQVNGALSYGLTLVYNSKIWDIISAASSTPGVFVPTADLSKSDNAGAGWRLSLGELQDPNSSGNYSVQWKYIGEDGAEHGFYTTLHIGETVVSNVWYTRNGSYLRLKKLSGTVFEVEFPDGTVRKFTRGADVPSSPFTLTQIRDRFGNKLDLSYFVNPIRWKLSDGYRTHWVYFRTLNSRTVVDHVDLAGFNGATAVYPFTYTSTSIHENCQDLNDLSSTMRTVPLLTSIGLPAAGGSFQNDYYTTCSDGFSSLPDLPGVLKQVTLPTLGALAWAYQMYTYPARGNFTPGEPSLELVSSLGVKTKTMKNASGNCTALGGVNCTWTYTSASPSPTVRTRTVTTPAGDQTVYYFNTIFGLKNGNETDPALRWTGWDYGLPYTGGTTSGTGFFLSQEIYGGAVSPANLKRAVYVGYEHDRLPTATNDPQDWYNTNRRVLREQTEYKDDSTVYGQTVYSKFDGLGHYRRRVTDGNFAASNVRTEHTEFNPNQGDYYVDPSTNVQNGGYSPWSSGGAWVIGTSTESWAQEGSTTLKTQTCFESATGFLGWKRTCGNSNCNQATDVLAVYTRGTDGNVAEEQYFGADSGGLSATAQSSACTVSGLPSTDYWIHHEYSSGSRRLSQYKYAAGNTMSFNSLDLVIDASTGLPKSFTDPSGVTTNYEYDSLGRLTWSKPTIGHGAWTEYVYAAAAGTTPAKATIRQLPNNSPGGSPLAEAEVQFDPFGRAWRDRKKLPGVGWTLVDTDRNSMGWVHTISERTTSDPPVEYTKYLSYDPFGRARTIRPPDTGGSHDVIVAYTGVRRIDRKVMVATGYSPATGAVTETQQITSEFYDRQGRLFRILEPSLGGATATETKYTYDPAGRLTQVTMGPQGQAVVQTRTFSYDNRGFLQWENHPEKTANTFGSGHDVDYRSYDALGHSWRRIDGANDLSFTFDRAERLTQARETGGQARVLKSFTYATSNDTNNWKKAKLESAIRYNYVAVGVTPVTVQLTESYTYGGIAGRMSKRDSQFYTGGAVSESFTQEWTYNDFGQVATATYPKCTTFAGCTPAAASPRTVTYGYTDGSLTSIPGFTGTASGQPPGIGITYHQNGMVNQVAHGNGMTDTQAVDPHLMRRLASFTSKFGATTRWASGTYTYDGSGNVAKVGSGTGQTAWYTYDELSRLKIGTVFTGATGGGTQKQQTFTYDPYGNITNIAGNPDPGRSTPTTTGTNRLTSGTYDAAGNLTAWNGASYAYDAFNMMWHMTSGLEDWLYLYNADDERIWSFKIGGGFSRWTLRGLGNEVLRDFTATGSTYAVEKDYIYRDGLLMASENPSVGSRRHYHLDHLGTPRLITNGSGVQQAYHAYYPFGEEATAFNQDTERMKFTGHERDLGNATGAGDDLDYMHARYCSPLTNRFFSFDPESEIELAEPQSWNRYAYGLNNPIKYVDREGRAFQLSHEVAASNREIRAAISDTLSSVPMIGPALAYAADYMVADYFPTNIEEAADSVKNSIISFGQVGLPTGGLGTIERRLQNAIWKNLDKATVEAAARESMGEIVALKPSGKPFDHLVKFEQARAGVRNALEKLRALSQDLHLTPQQRAEVKHLLGKYSKKIDAIEEYFANMRAKVKSGG